MFVVYFLSKTFVTEIILDFIVVSGTAADRPYMHASH